MYDTNRLVMIVHAIDTEGPLHEPTAATFERLAHLFGVTGLPKTKATLGLLKEKKIPLGGKEEQVAQLLGTHSLDYKKNWQEVDEMLGRIMDTKFRNAFPDSYGGGWVYNWHCLDHVGFKTNERFRDLGYHNIFDHYRAALNTDKRCPDALHYHFHYISTYREAHRCATSFLNSAPEFLEVLCRRIIERQWFPKAARAGFQTERPDSNFFLEQWIPYDLSNMAQDDNRALEGLTDFRKGRSGNWRKAPADWSVYHPSHDDYQTPGQCRRWIGRALNPLNRVGALTRREVEKAFRRADKGLPTLLGVAGHDFRDLGREVDYVRSLLREVAPAYPRVKFKYAEEVEAFRRATGAPERIKDPLKLEVKLNRAPEGDVPNLDIIARRGRVFGPQPFLAIETKSGRFIHDNLDFGEKDGLWHYAFHSDTLPLKDIRRIGVAANDAYATQSLTVLDVA
ncbi:MAG: hypothetical protein A2W52_01060 [Candidatus Taylorbacteria bacterium RIFCSPHIGHO2_02_49_25]|uniref:Uncharacterized protein n=1 Tax=Candidatus Taylorbacteria bacterium RIFCSPHIGHO2_02_49_25 TaxID=1802305 RepID=A0A1G2MD67_9BACT|nr:MAG: hypothetical protein UY62_C0015G0004 [Parcubacteria group bacterium GW2011_GWF2_50_9]OHA19198.1 MAG: hypothetical protein A2759_00720 [Candidatus Taylorbacteria bacterium RIFCSPHIGHO2_01_FULL_49_60]OHA20972.1 MAG: hypothetical protein A2W52_01060 [Candidatus Taylorbacteria bacterium RIFCSPHIGHO2_02_49_25]OHA36337.1 MAG: hypothetical protein A3B27_02815 [Candidatus Taylorbacteria bacterium RIFCSPLOWO2_01_FULL_50_130]OHA37271.1 MAG: hypothetical protein A2W65_03305 [Candidatus Taylorbacte